MKINLISISKNYDKNPFLLIFSLFALSCNQTPKKNSNEKSTLKEVSETPNILTVNYNLDEMTAEEHSELGTNARNCR